MIKRNNERIKVLSIVILLIISWFGLIATGYGTQSLSQLIEIPIVLVASFTIGYLMKNHKLYRIITAVLMFVLILRCLMPQIPE